MEVAKLFLIMYCVAVLLVAFKYFLKIMAYFVYKVLMEAADLIPLIGLTFIPYLWNDLRRVYRWIFRRQRTRKYNIMSPYCFEVVDYMEDLAKDLAPSSEYLREGRKAAQKIFEKLKRDGREYGLKIGRTKIAGSFGKGTGISYMLEDGSIRNPDLDLVVIVNDVRPPFDNVFEQFKNLLEEIPEIYSDTIHVKKYSIKFVISTETQGDIKVDLLAAMNLVKHVSPWAGQDISQVSAELALQELGETQLISILQNQSIDLENNKNYSAAFADKTIDLINGYIQDPFILKVVRLAKFWNARVDLGHTRPARSCMIEVIAIWAQRKKRGRTRNGQRCIVCGLRRFLEAIRDLKSLDIPCLSDIKNNNNENGIQMHTLPVVRDPVNPFNNLTHGLQSSTIHILSNQAKMTLKMLENFKRGVDYESFENAIDEIFYHKCWQKISHR